MSVVVTSVVDGVVDGVVVVGVVAVGVVKTMFSMIFPGFVVSHLSRQDTLTTH